MSEVENIRAAGVRQTDRQLVGKDTASIVKAAKHEISSTWRVYTKEWLLTARGKTQDETYAVFTAKYDGRVQSDDWDNLYDPESDTWVLRLHLWNVKAEWKTEALARTHAQGIATLSPDTQIDVVARNSRKEHVLMNYGKLLLPKKKDDKAAAPTPA